HRLYRGADNPQTWALSWLLPRPSHVQRNNNALRRRRAPALSGRDLTGLWLASRVGHLGDLGDELADNRFAKTVEGLCHPHEGPRAADDIVAIVMIKPALRIGVFRVPGQRRFAQDRESIDRDSLGHRLVAQFSDVAAGIVGAVTGNVDGVAARSEWRAGKLGHGKFDGAADRGAIGEGARRFQ